MIITICGSMRFVKEMQEWKEKLEAKGYEVYAPDGVNQLNNYKESGSSAEATKLKIAKDLIRSHYQYIKKSDGILVLNYDKDGKENYIGGNTFLEMGFAFTQNRDIFLVNPVPDLPYSSELNAMQPIVINNELDEIINYYENLPTVHLSSESIVKLRATSLALREYNLRYKVLGFKTQSGVNEQPYSIEETHQGAENRLLNLKSIYTDKKPKLWISIESGDAVIHPKYNYYGLSVCIIEDETGKQGVTIGTDLEIPKELTDLVPSKYPDLGILVQKKFGVENKDPYIYFTNGKLSREQLVFNSVVNTLACL